MIDLIDNIGVLIDESIEIPDIDKEDEFIISIDNDLLNEGLQRQFAEIGIILDSLGSNLDGTSGGSGGVKNEWEEWEKVAERERRKEAQIQAKKEAAARQDEADRASRGPNLDGTYGGSGGAKDEWEKAAERERRKEAQIQAKKEAAARQDEADRASRGPNLDGTSGGSGGESPGFMSAVGAAVKENPLLALGGAVLAAAGAYAVYRYMNSIYRLNKATNYYKKLASSASDPAKKAKYAEKAGMYEKRLEAAKAKARENKKDYIAKTKTMQGQLAEMKKSGGDAKAIAKLEKKLASRNKVLAKIGAL